MNFMASALFYSHLKKEIPSAGYRPHIVMECDGEREYLGVLFYDLEMDQPGQRGYVLCSCLYEKTGWVIKKFKSGASFL